MCNLDEDSIFRCHDASGNGCAGKHKQEDDEFEYHYDAAFGPLAWVVVVSVAVFWLGVVALVMGGALAVWKWVLFC